MCADDVGQLLRSIHTDLLLQILRKVVTTSVLPSTLNVGLVSAPQRHDRSLPLCVPGRVFLLSSHSNIR